jgi:hypothetical protein
MSQQFFVHIPEPCHEDWNKMSPTQQGAFCGSCSKQVVDFTQMSDDEILKTISKAAGKTCGRFTEEQLSRPIEYMHAPLVSKFNAKYLYQLMITSVFAATQGIAQTGKKDNTTKTTMKNMVKGDTNVLVKTTKTATCTLEVKQLKQQVGNNQVMLGKLAFSALKSSPVRGRVVDANGQPVTNANIAINQKKDVIRTKSDGSFIVDRLLLSPGELIITADGFERQQLVVNDNENVLITLQRKVDRKAGFLGEVAVMPAKVLAGKVMNERSEPLPLATVHFPELNMTIVADEEGRFSVSFPYGTKAVSIEASYVGYHPATIAIDHINERDTVTVQLQTNNVLRDAVVTSQLNYLVGRVGGISVVRSVTAKDTATTFVRKLLKSEVFTVVPNPVSRGQQVQLKLRKAGKYYITVFDTNGKLYTQENVEVSAHSLQQLLNIPATMSAGSYYIRAINTRTNNQFVDKLIVQ